MFTAEAQLAKRMERNSKWVTVDGVVHIQLPCGREVLIDEQDRELASQFTWSVTTTATGPVYAEARIPKAMSDRFKGKSVKLHRLILGTPVGFDTDHKDRNGLNCCRSNLRVATRSQNGANRTWPAGKKSQYRGIAPCCNKWVAKIQVNRKERYLGLFSTELEAAAAYNQAAKEYHGEFAVLNTIEAH